ncbi:hypothetical protein Zm00014a_020701 [Zea mays]|jgi:hypothetical protein|uniref:Transcriptional regulator of RNA polII SAGA subunit n=2 Tax=Zea mays TaxID=4577 RepID=A0A096SEW4_MAIZE|nr:uncharacterized protein LOC100272667 [Zea mays]XP_020403956.1 uncharacterized protein LOC100272667 [Zea mays]XP_020403957.1 uncharacterized protein LOC100272667 [Zea mays]XP_020403958.1 uncharacterized protein LOC100272667 [Zea mays]XP_020403959.1 uncharacterized protein LOC100272667 [Zea mays]XP_020403960.1 uncharacterized protein LOC100272667 [Zea mays]XP_035821214.1 uncharacterized protein LOC100272667 [Zea mays]ONM18632.1 hypothetical protein ZEAMMB73_Zm00001d004222 [Zea mays]PWZ3981|eukprot:XP_008669619.1 uncharacterized protein LOC100272667 [Zea mays]
MPSSTPPSVQPTPSLQPLPSPAVSQSTRIDVREIKSKIFKTIGPERAKKYFQHLERFLSSKLSKNEFEKLCLVALGRDNLPLHNHLIRSILHNASRACGPPVINDPRLVRGATTSGHVIVPPVWDNGGPLNLNVKENRPLSRRENLLTQKPSLNHCDAIMLENGVHHLSDLKRCTQFQNSDHVEPLFKRPRMEKEPFSLHNSLQSNGSAKASRENLGQEIIHQPEGPVQAPLGIQLRPGNFGVARIPLSSVSSKDTSDTCIEVGELCDTLSVKKRLDKMAGASGLEGVSIECANLLNNGIDVFMKQLIGSCVELVRARSRHGKLRHDALKQQMCRKLINGVSVHTHVSGQSSIIPPETNSISMQDLKAVIELNPCLLGINASLLLEKINSYD